jgi:hypothetical protein
MMLSGIQVSTGAIAITVGVANTNTTLLSNPGATVRLRVYSASMGNNPVNAGKVRVMLRELSTGFVFGILAIGTAEAGDHLWFGEGGYPLVGGSGIEARHVASVAGQDINIQVCYSQHWIG